MIGLPMKFLLHRCNIEILLKPNRTIPFLVTYILRFQDRSFLSRIETLFPKSKLFSGIEASLKAWNLNLNLNCNNKLETKLQFLEKKLPF